VIVADVNGAVVIPIECLAEVLSSAVEMMAKELAMLEALRSGESILDVDRRVNYEQMLRAGRELAPVSGDCWRFD
jgi:regulator of RNase E activity RraA